MIFTQPVVYELPLLKAPTLLMIGTKDTTAIGKDFAPARCRRQARPLRGTGDADPGGDPRRDAEDLPDAGHAPQIQDPDAFDAALIEGLERMRR